MIRQLEKRVSQLAANVNSAARELDQLRFELQQMKVDPGNPEAHSTEKMSKEEKLKETAFTQTGSSWLENFIGLKLIHVAGIIVLVTGISIGVKYAVDQQLISEGLRIVLAYLAGIVLFIFSARLRKKYKIFSAILFSGSMASLYFTTYGASIYYQFFPSLIAFIAMLLLTVYTAIRAIDYDRKEIAIIGMIGAYGIPFLVSANADRIDLFFSYILLINLGVGFLSFRKSWKLMSQLAMFMTWIIFIGWALLRNDGSEGSTAILFMIIFFLLFLFTAIGFNLRNRFPLTTAETTQVILNNIGFYLASLLVLAGNDPTDYHLAAVTGGASLVATLLSILSYLFLPGEKLMQRLLVWQTIFFVLLFIALQWDGLTVSVLWLLVSALLFLWGVFKNVSWSRLASVFLIGLVLVKLLLFDSENFTTVQKIAAYLIIGALLLIFSFYYQKLGLARKKQE